MAAFDPSENDYMLAVVSFTGTQFELSYQASIPGVVHYYGGSIGVGDLDADGKDDVAVPINQTNDIQLLRSTGTTVTGFGTGGAFTSVTAPTAPNTARLLDVDASGTVDLLVGRAGGLSYWHGQGNGTFLTVNGTSRTDRAIPDAKGLELAYDDGEVLPHVVVSQGQPDGRVSFLHNQSVN